MEHGKPLNPKTFIMGIRDMSVEAEHGLNLIPNSPIVRDTYGLDDSRPAAMAMAKPIVDEAIPFDAVWDCVTCGACVEACPVLIEHVDKIVEAAPEPRAGRIALPAGVDGRLPVDGGSGQSMGSAGLQRMDWTKPLPFEVPTVASLASDGRLDDLEVLYWVGCAAAFDPRTRRSPGPSRPVCTPRA